MSHLTTSSQPASPRSAAQCRTFGECASDGPLAGVRVIELATVIMGPYAGQQFGDLGADVIKVESPDGDSTRGFEPSRHPGMGGPTLNLNRNKRSITLDLKSREDHATMLRLLDSADIFFTNVRPSALERLGLDPEILTARYPQLVLVQAQGFRTDSALRDNAAYDDIIQAASGLVALNEQVSGQPFYTPTVLADKVCGLMIVQSALAALHHRDRTGLGQHVEVPMADTMIAFNLVEHLAGASLVSSADESFDEVRSRFSEPNSERGYGYERVLSPERRACRTADGWMCILPYSDRNWREFFEVAGDPDAVLDSRFATMAARTVNADSLNSRMHSLTGRFTTARWQQLCDERSIPAHPVLGLAECAESPYAQETGLVSVLDHPSEGSYRAVAHPIRYSLTPSRIRRHCPSNGQDGREIRAELEAPTHKSTEVLS
nr:CoA transferase [uncultured Rhodococcus sp.]